MLNDRFTNHKYYATPDQTRYDLYVLTLSLKANISVRSTAMASKLVVQASGGVSSSGRSGTAGAWVERGGALGGGALDEVVGAGGVTMGGRGSGRCVDGDFEPGRRNEHESMKRAIEYTQRENGQQADQYNINKHRG